MFEQRDKNKPGAIVPVSFENTNAAYEGTVWKTNEGYYIKILRYNDKYNVDIRYLHNGFETTARMGNIKTGAVKNPYHPNKYGAWFGVGPYTKNQHIKIYTAWMNILKRLSEEGQINNSRNAAYKTVSLCPDWYDYQKFAYWFDNYISSLNPELYVDYQLDKDILQWDKQYKVYSPQTCCLIPSKLNLALCNMNTEKVTEPDLPLAVHRNGKGGNTYMINISIDGEHPYLGSFNDPMEAFNVYKQHKEKYLRELVDYYLSINAIHKDVHDAVYAIDIKPFK